MGEKLSFRDVSSEFTDDISIQYNTIFTDDISIQYNTIFTDDISIQYNTIFICHIRHLHMEKKMKKIDDRK